MIYADDGKGGGEIIVGRRPDQNEIDGFIPVTSGQTIRHHKRPSNFSVLISGISEKIDVPTLAKLFKEGKIAEKGDHEAFIGSPDVSAPSGFHKITLPFMDPSHSLSDSSNLPSIFIAPLGYKAPKGYKGHPLPFDPAPTDPLHSSASSSKINLVHTTEPSSSSEVHDNVNLENEVKTTRFKNPFLRNKLRNQRLPYRPIKTTSTTEFSVPLGAISDGLFTTEKTESRLDGNESKEPSNYVRSKLKFSRNRFKPQRKRVLTKIVRKPYTPSITTPSPTLETKKIVRIVEPTSISLKVEEYFPPTSGRPILGDGRNDDKIDLVVDQDYNITSVNPSLGISTTFRPIQIKYLDIQSTKKAITFFEPKPTHIVSDVSENKDEIQFVETENNVVDHFEPTTTHNNLIFETTKPAEETTNSNLETDNKDVYDDDELTTAPPTSFVTRNTFVPPVTTFRPTTKIIQFVPYSPAATTRKTTSPTKITSKIVTDPNHSYEPTPFNFLDPIARLERLNQLKNKKYGKNRPSLIDKEEENEYVIPTVRPTSSQLSEKVSYKVHNNRIKYRKYGYNQGKDDGRIFGQRLKERKRPKLWDNGYVRDNFYATTTEAIENATAKKSKSEEYKRKFRPFFDQLYERLTNDKDKDTETPDGNNRRISVFSVRRKIRPYKGWRKKSRSTTTPNPFTINAEIYEVHPESRARITTTTTSTPPPTFEVITESSTIYQDYANELETGDYKPSILVNKDETPNHYEPIHEQDHYNDENEVHETADKHSPVHHDYGLEKTSFSIQNPKSSSILIPFQDQSQFKPSLQETNDFSHNGLVDSNVALEFGESQFVESSLNELVASSPKSSAAPATRLLDQYQKTFKPSTEIANEHDSSYQKPNKIINEHSQQKLSVKEGDFIPFHNVREGDHWEPRPLVPYVEIQRVTASENKAPLSISVETVPTDDTSLIQEVLEEVSSGNIPVDVGLAQQKTSDSQNEIYPKPLPDYTNDHGENEDYEESTSTRVSITTKNEPIATTTIRVSKNVDDEGDVTTTKHYSFGSENIEAGDTTISFFVTPTTTQNTNAYHDEILSDPGPTIQESSLIIENGDLDESTTPLVSLIKEESSQETTSVEEHTEITEEATPEVVNETETDDHTSSNSEKDTTISITTVSPTTVVDNFEVTTFRPKSNGGFFENFNLANLLSYIVPKRKTTITPLPITTTVTTKTTEEESKPTTEITTTRFTDEKSETVFNPNLKYTTLKLSDQDVISTDLPSTVSYEEIVEQTTLVQNEESNDITKTLGTTTSPDTTKIFLSAIPVQDKTTVRDIVNVPDSAFETTTEQEVIDTTTTSDVGIKTTTSKPEETTRYHYEYDDDKTTVPNYIATTLNSRIRTERPFRGPFRLQKTYKKGGNRYQFKNKSKKYGAGLLKKIDDKHKKDSTISKAVYGAIKREEYIKNWVARKYNKLENNSKKRLFSLNATYQPPTTIGPSQETTPAEPTTSESQTSLASSSVVTSTHKNAALPFSPTVLPPKNKLFNVDLDTTIRDGGSSSSVGKASSIIAVSSVKNVISEKRKTFLDKLKSSARKSLSDNLFAKNIKNGKISETSSSSISLPTQKSSKKIAWVYPRGSDTKVFKTWGGSSLSQAEFERKVLGVSTATEVSVKSMICVRGRCYNADDKSLANN